MVNAICNGLQNGASFTTSLIFERGHFAQTAHMPRNVAEFRLEWRLNQPFSCYKIRKFELWKYKAIFCV